MNKILHTIFFAFVCGLSASAQSGLISFYVARTSTSPEVYQIYGVNDGDAHTFSTGIDAFSFTIEYPRSATGVADFTVAGALAAWNTQLRNGVVYNPTYFTGSSSNSTRGDLGGTAALINTSTNLSTNFATTGTSNINGQQFPKNAKILLATITIPSSSTISGSNLTMKDWANNTAYGLGAPLFAWSINFDGNSKENVSQIFLPSIQSNAPTNSGAATGTSFVTFNPGAPLPVELVRFDATRSGPHQSQLTWSTQSEHGTSHFDVQRSADGRTFDTHIDRVSAQGNSSALRNYQTFDNDPIIGDNFYRLRIVDHDGQFAYSEIRKVVFTPGTGAVTASPNPFQGATTVHITSLRNETVRYQVLDAWSKVVRTGQWSATAGGSDHTLNLSDLSAGLYVVHVDGETVHAQIKLTKHQ